MKFISITKSINIRPDWASIGARLKAGTPLDITGAVANSSAAVGILADDAEKSSAEVAVVTEGSIDLAEITASYGELEDDCISAIKGISFIGSDGDPIVPSGGGLPDYSEASDGDVLGISSGEPSWVTPSGGGYLLLTRGNTGAVTGATAAEIRAAWTDGTPIFIKWGNEMRPANYMYDESNDKTYVESELVQLSQDPAEGLYVAYISRWRIEVGTSTLGNCAAYSERLALYSDLNGGYEGGNEGGVGF